MDPITIWRHLTDWPGLFYLTIHLPLLYLVRLMDSVLSIFTQYSLLHGRKRYMSSEKKCQLVRILWRSNYTPFYKHSLDNYMTIHEDWIDTEYVLANNSVTLQGVSSTHAWFCVPDPSVDVYSPDLFPFVFVNQYLMAEKLVVVSLDVFHQMADSVGDPKVPVTILNNMGRCGSTMVCKALSQIPDLMVMSEPWSLLNVLCLYRKGAFGLDTYSKLITSVLRIQCKISAPLPSNQIAIKFPFPCMAQASLIKSLIPTVRHIYLFRSPKESIASLAKVWKAYPPIFKALGYLEDFQKTHHPLVDTISPRNIPEMISRGVMSRNKAVVFTILASLRSARDFVERSGPFAAIFTFEEFLGEGDGMLRLFRLFDCKTIDKSWKKKDSQANTFISQANLKGIEAGTEEKTDELLDLFQLPGFDAPLDDFKTYIENGPV